MICNVEHIGQRMLLELPILVVLIMLIVYLCRYCRVFKGQNTNDSNAGVIIRNSLNQNFPGYIFYGLSLVAITLILVVVAKFMHPHCYIWDTIEIFFKNHSVFGSIIGTMIGLALTFLFLRPKLILRRAYLYKMKDGERLSLCIANWGIFPVHDIQVNVFWVRDINRDYPNDHDFQREWKTKRIQVFRPEINGIDGIFSERNTYSCHGEQPFAQDMREKYNTYGEDILCRVQATHSLSGLSRVYEWKFKIQDIEGIDMLEEKEASDKLKYVLSINKRSGEATIENYKRKGCVE